MGNAREQLLISQHRHYVQSYLEKLASALDGMDAWDDDQAESILLKLNTEMGPEPEGEELYDGRDLAAGIITAVLNYRLSKGEVPEGLLARVDVRADALSKDGYRTLER